MGKTRVNIDGLLAAQLVYYRIDDSEFPFSLHSLVLALICSV